MRWDGWRKHSRVQNQAGRMFDGLLRGDSCIVLRKTGAELGSHAVQRSEKHIVQSPRRVGSILPCIAG